MSSLTDVAKRAGVSIATVSRVISRPDKVTTSTQELVRRVMRELDYTPNRVARRLRQQRGQGHLLALIIPDIQNPFFAEMARGVEDVAYANESAVMLCNSDEDLKKEAFYLDVMRGESVDGIILPPINDRDSSLLQFLKAGVPIVTVDRSLLHSPVDQVEVDNRIGAYEAVSYLIAAGHKRIGLITGRVDVSTSRERKQGYEDALASHHIELRPEYIGLGDNRQPSGEALASQLLRLAKPLTALFVTNNLMTVGALQAIHRLGLKIPNDVAIIGFDDLPWAEALNPPLTVVRQPAYDIGHAAAELLLRRLNNPQVAPAAIRLRPKLIIRQSC